jgi:plasmid maintenance system antidote protein VapI
VTAYAGGVSAPPPDVLVRLAQVLEVPTTELAPLSARPILHELRWHAGLTNADLAQQVDLTRDYVSRILRGEVGITDQERWADALGVSPAEVQQAWENTHALLNRRT